MLPFVQSGSKQVVLSMRPIMRYPDHPSRRVPQSGTVKVTEATKEVFAPQAQVMIAGSRAKKTDLATSDQDYYIAWETPVTLQNREDLQEELEKRFLGAVEVTKHGTLRVPGESGQLCITFARAIFYDESFEASAMSLKRPQVGGCIAWFPMKERARLDKDAFKHNRPAQQAVRASWQTPLSERIICEPAETPSPATCGPRL